MSGARHYRKRKHQPVERPILPDEIERILREIAEEPIPRTRNSYDLRAKKKGQALDLPPSAT